MKEEVWYVLESMLLLSEGVTQGELLLKYKFPLKYIFLADDFVKKIGVCT